MAGMISDIFMVVAITNIRIRIITITTALPVAKIGLKP